MLVARATPQCLGVSWKKCPFLLGEAALCWDTGLMGNTSTPCVGKPAQLYAVAPDMLTAQAWMMHLAWSRGPWLHTTHSP